MAGVSEWRRRVAGEVGDGAPFWLGVAPRCVWVGGWRHADTRVDEWRRAVKGDDVGGVSVWRGWVRKAAQWQEQVGGVAPQVCLHAVTGVDG
jgi:hypothetical protein